MAVMRAATLSMAPRTIGGGMGVFRSLTPFTGAALVVMTLCGCAGPTPPENPADAPTTSATTEETFSTPPPEPTAPVSTAPGEANGTPIIALPRLPIGGQATLDPDAGRQCVEVSWIATVNGDDAFPAGYAVEITRAWFSDKGFEAIRSGCGHDPPNCLGHIMRTGSPSCRLAVRALPGADPAKSVSVGLKGIAYCPKSVGRTGCERFVDSLGSQQPQHLITLLPAPEQPTSTDSSTTPTTGQDGQPSVGPDSAPTITPSGG
jgi:hypothetical protein